MSFSDTEKAAILELNHSTNFPQLEIENLYKLFKLNFVPNMQEVAAVELFKTLVLHAQYLSFKSLPRDIGELTSLHSLNFEFRSNQQKKQEEDFKQRQLIHETANINGYYNGALESFKAAIGFADSSIKSLILANGGALIAVSAFLQQLITKRPQLAEEVAESTIYFVIGLVTAILVPMFSYLFQALITEKQPEQKTALSKFCVSLRIAAIISAVASISLFTYGGSEIFSILSDINSADTTPH